MTKRFTSIDTLIPAAWPAMTASFMFGIGIIAAFYAGTSALAIPFAVLAVLSGGLSLVLKGARADTASCLLMLFSGSFAVVMAGECRTPMVFGDDDVGCHAYVEGTVHGSGRLRNGAFHFTVDVEKLHFEGNAPVCGQLLSCAAYQSGEILPEGADVAVFGTVKRRRLPLSAYSSRYGSGEFRLILDSDDPAPKIIREGNGLAANLRNHLRELAGLLGFDENTSVFRAMTFGDTAGLDAAQRLLFSRAGMAHVLAVSGLHAGIVAAAAALLAGLFGLSGYRKSLAVVTVVVLYALLCGLRPPIVRAAVMLIALSFAPLAGRKGQAENILFFALLLILAIMPASLFGASLQLSFTAVWGLIVLNVPFRRLRPRGWTGRLCDLLFVSVVASAMTAPLTAFHFGSVPLYGVAANVFAVPLTFLIVPVGLFSLLIAAFYPVLLPFARFVAFPAVVLLEFLQRTAHFFQGLPLSELHFGAVPFLLLGGLFVTFYLISRSQGRPSFARAAVYVPLCCMLVIAWLPLVPAGIVPGHESRTVFFDVGQGDAALVRASDGSAFLIDTGPVYSSYDAAKAMILPSLDNMGVKRLDALVISHLHEDHFGGLSSVLEGIEVDRIFAANSAVEQLKAMTGREVSGLAAGDSLAFSDGGCLVLSPLAEVQNTGGRSGENDRSLVMRFSLSGNRILMCGDIEPLMQHRLMCWKECLAADILKVPHHGAKGLDPGFCETVNAKTAFISCGLGNRFGHPAGETLTVLAESGASVWRSDRNGSLSRALELTDSAFR